MIVVHYHRFDNDYGGVTLWTWAPEGDHHPSDPERSPAGWDEFGPFFNISPELFYRNGEPGPIGILPRLRQDWRFKDGEDRFWLPRMGNEIWLLSDDPQVYAARPDISPRIHTAFLDGKRLITAKLSHSIETFRVRPGMFRLECSEGSAPSIAGVQPLDARDGRVTILLITTAGDLDPAVRYSLGAAGYRPARVYLRNVFLENEDYHYKGLMGAIYSPEKTRFRLFAPEADEAHVLLYSGPHYGSECVSHPMAPLEKGVWEATIKGDLHGQPYRVRVISDDAHTGREVIDPYSTANTGHDGHGMVADLRRFDPPGFRPISRPHFSGVPTDAIIWETHLRDFTICPNSGVPGEVRGKYLGATLRGTTIPGTDIPTTIGHLVELGITHVQLLPIQDFDNEENSDRYNWGYMPANFFSPDGWFATDIRNASRVTETKRMIQAFHEAGIRVILDVVYNHTAATAPFEAIAPRYYHRRRDDGSFWNGSGCGNEFRTEAPMARKLIVDSCRHWVEEYGVDGFRFDLMGLVDLETMQAVRDELTALDPTLLIYGEPWAVAPPEEVGIRRLTSRFMIAGSGIAAYNDHFRDDVKGTPDGPSPGYVQTGTRCESLRRGIQGAIFDWAWHPTDVVQYVSCHDNLTLWDKLAISAPEVAEMERMKMQMMALGILLLSQGVPMLHAGAEMLRTKGAVANSFDSPDSVNQLDWEGKKRYPEVVEFVRGLIAIRRNHPVFRLATREEVQGRLHFQDRLCPADSCLAWTIYGGSLEKESWEEVLILLNPGQKGLEFRLPRGQWEIHVHGTKVSPARPFGSAVTQHLVPGRSIAVLARGKSG